MAGVKPDPVQMEPSLQEQLGQFQTFLEDLRLPGVVDRRDRPRDGAQDHITIATLADFDQFLNIFIEGSRRCPESLVFCTSATWLSRQPSCKHPRLFTLFVHQGFTADNGGQTYLDKFSPPRQVTYMVNHLLTSPSEVRRAEGAVVGGWQLETPCSSSTPLNHRVSNTLLTTRICAEAGKVYPATLGFWVRQEDNGTRDHHDDSGAEYEDITAVKLKPGSVNLDHVQSKVEAFLKSSTMQHYDQVVVKMFGPAWNSWRTGCSSTFHTKDGVKRIMRSVTAKLAEAGVGSGVVVQAFIPTLEPVVTAGLGRHAISTERKQLAFRIRAIVARTANKNARMTQVVVAIDDVQKPTTSTTTTPVTLEAALRLWGIKDPNRREDIHRALRSTAEHLMLELMAQEERLTAEERGGHGCQTDVVGMDFILTKINDTITPVCIGMKNHDCTYQCTVLEVINPQMLGYASSAFLQVMLARSQRYAMQDKIVLVVGPGGFSRRKLYADARHYGIKIVIVDSNPDHPAKKDVFKFLPLDFSDHRQDERHALDIVERLREALPGMRVDGCLTFFEDCVPLAALVSELLELRHLPTVQAARNAKSKLRTQQVLFNLPHQPSHRPPPRLCACPTYTIRNVADLPKAVQVVPLPAILKLEYGNSAVGVKLVNDLEEARQHVEYVHRALHCEEDHPGIGLTHGKTMLLMQRLLGTEHDVDLVLFQGQLMSAFISDNGPTRMPFCMETAALMPSVLSPEWQQQLIQAAACCCRELGLHTGVYNVEMIMTARGPRLIEINGRMGGFYLRDWIRRLYDVDLMLCAMLCACGIPPAATGPSSLSASPPGAVQDVLMGLMLYPSRHYRALTGLAAPQRLQAMHDQDDLVIYTPLEPQLEAPKGEKCQDEECFAHLAVKGRSVEDAKAKLVALFVSLGLETEDEIQPLLGDFVEAA